MAAAASSASRASASARAATGTLRGQPAQSRQAIRAGHALGARRTSKTARQAVIARLAFTFWRAATAARGRVA